MWDSLGEEQKQVRQRKMQEGPMFKITWPVPWTFSGCSHSLNMIASYESFFFFLSWGIKTHEHFNPDSSVVIDCSVSLRMHVHSPSRGGLEKIQAVASKHKLLMIIFSFSIMGNFYPLFKKSTTKGLGPSCLPFHWSCFRILVLSWWVSKLWSRLCMSHYDHWAFEIVFQVHLKARQCERYSEISHAGGRYFLRGLVSSPCLCNSSAQMKRRMDSLGVEPPLAPCMKLQLPLIGVNFSKTTEGWTLLNDNTEWLFQEFRIEKSIFLYKSRTCLMKSFLPALLHCMAKP